jgi:hypothetical protein
MVVTVIKPATSSARGSGRDQSNLGAIARGPYTRPTKQGSLAAYRSLRRFRRSATAAGSDEAPVRGSRPPFVAFDGERLFARPKLYVASDLRSVGFAFCPAAKGWCLIRMDYLHVAVLQIEIQHHRPSKDCHSLPPIRFLKNRFKFTLSHRPTRF